jgi:hypothetical protein
VAFLASCLPVTDNNLISYQFSRDKVERGDCTHFLNRCGVDHLPI